MQSFRITATRSEAEDLYKVEIEVLTSPISPYSNLIAIKLAKSI